MNIVTVKIGIGALDPITKLPIVQAINPIEDDTDFEDFGETAYFGPIGLTSIPYSQDNSGYCEAIVARDIAGLNGVILGYRDERVAEVYGALGPGDTSLHTSGPNHVSQVLLKEDARQACVLTKDSGNKDIGLQVDGTANAIQLFGFECGIKISEEGVTLFAGGSTIQLGRDGVILLNGTQVYLGGAATVAGAVAFSAAGPVNLISKSVFTQP